MKDINALFETFLGNSHVSRSNQNAIFVVGSIGSGKDYVIKTTFRDMELSEVQSDKLSKTLKESSKNVSDIRYTNLLNSKSGLIITDTGEDVSKLSSLKLTLESLGYATGILFVHVDNEVSKLRNEQRYLRGSRILSESSREFKWNSFQENCQKLKNIFENHWEIDNSVNLSESSNSFKTFSYKKSLENLRKNILEFVSGESSGMLSEASVSADTPEELKGINGIFKKLLNTSEEKEESKEPEEPDDVKESSYQLSNPSRDYLTLGKEVPVIDLTESPRIVSESVETPKKTLRSFRESIDRGIEPGLSMATSGENATRGATKVKKKDSILELTGDETTVSTSAAKEDKLKKVGLVDNGTIQKR